MLSSIQDSTTPATIDRGITSSSSKDQFLKILITQLKYQDPLQPPDANKFTEQMTSFGQLEQLMNLNKSMENAAAQQSNSSRSQAVSYIGKSALIQGSRISLTPGASVDIGYSLANNAQGASVDVMNSNGAVVRTYNFASPQAGTNVFSFDGKDQNGNLLPAGSYQLRVSGTTSDGQVMTTGITPLLRGRVTSVDFSGADPLVEIGGELVGLNKILSVSL